MVEQGSGVIINVSSGGASRAHRGMVAYDSAKGGVEAFTRAVAVDLAPYGVRCVCIVPGLMESAVPNAERAHASAATVPLGRQGTGADIAGAAVFLASEDASYLTGSCLYVDGGVLHQQRSPQVETFPLDRFPRVGRLADLHVPPRMGYVGSAVFRRSYVDARLSRTAGREPTIRGRPQLFHDMSIKLYLMLQRDRGQTMAEYAVVLAVIAIGIFVALGTPPRLDRRRTQQGHVARSRRRTPAVAGTRRRDVQRRVAVEEPDGLQPKAGLGDRHDRPVLGTHEVRRADRVPEHDVAVVERAIRLAPLR